PGGRALAIGALVTGLAAAGLVWALTGGGGSDGGASAGGATTGGSGKDSAPQDGAGTAGPSSSTGSGPAAVTVTIAALRDRYSGPCPAPVASAPVFQAAVAVDRVPADVGYRWVTGSGSVTDGGWKTVRIAEGTRSVVLKHTEVSHRAGDPDQDWMALEVRSPRQLTSRRVPFTVSCTTPPAGTPSTARPSPAPSSPGRPTPGPSGSSGSSATGPGGYSGGAYGSGH
ncbi:hypothetical protein LE181_31370, partial [Streptomyces sp. SCA3-4]|nr:hypothetical protein [Streptomyces sichuanensis]